MINKTKKETLADKISNILSTTPATFDPEDDVAEETKAKVTENDAEDEADDDEAILSKFRKQNVDLLEDVDVRYAGKKGSRKDLADSDEEWETESDGDAEDESESDIDDGGKNISDEEETDGEEEEDDDSDSDGEGSEGGVSLDDSNFQHIKDTDVPTQLKKGVCVRNQLNIWENLLEMRIQLQKCLITANKMPQNETYKDIQKDSGEQFTSKVTETKKSVTNVLDKLLQLQALLLKQYPETQNLHRKNAKARKEESDEEIPSDSDLEKSDVDMDEDDDGKVEEVPKKRRKLAEYERDIGENHKKYKDYRNSVIQKWNEKTRIAVAKSNSAVHSVLNQIEHNLSDRTKLVRRTQMKRSGYQIVGVKEPDEEQDESKAPQEFNCEIFDDDDFYHQLLRELIEFKSSDVTDPVQLGRQWIQLQNLRSKMKRKIDTRATKGRKIRYTVHSKLVNFMAPIDNNLWTDGAKTELFNSLFGKNQPAYTA